MNIVRKVIFGFIWFIVLYFFIAAALGAIAGGIAGANDPAHAGEAGGLAGRAIVAGNLGYIVLVSAVVAVVGAVKGFLPGTRTKKD